MAGDWIKIEKATVRKREVLVMAGRLQIHPDHAFGLCFRFWCWCDDNLSTCHAKNVTFVTLDSLLGHDGFADAASFVGWLIDNDGSLEIPNFERHLSKSAKSRALSNDRKKKSRSRHDPSVTKAGLEKRREEKSKGCPPSSDTPAPKGAGGGKKFLPPTEEEFTGYLIDEMPKINPEWTADRVKSAASLQFETFVSNGWKDGNNKPVKNWKTKTKNIMIHKKPWSFGELKLTPSDAPPNIGGRTMSITKISDFADKPETQDEIPNQ